MSDEILKETDEQKTEGALAKIIYAWDDGSVKSVRQAKRKKMSRSEYRARVEKLRNDLDTEVVRQINSLSGEEREWAIQVLRDLKDAGDPQKSIAYQQLWEIDYKWQPVPVAEFLADEYYMKNSAETLYGVWREELNEVFAPDSKVTEWHLGGCFVGSTRILLADGTTPTIAELTTERRIPFPVMAFNAAGDRVMAIGHSARVTKYTRDLVTVFFNGTKSETCTPDHKWLLFNGTWVEAEKLKPGDKLISRQIVRNVVQVTMPEPVPVYDITVDTHHNFVLASGPCVHNSIGCGKTYVAGIATSYVLYKMSCLRNPQRYYGLSAKSKICFGIYSATKTQVQDVAYDKLRMFLEDSPYFKEKFPMNPRLTSRIEFPGQNILIVAGSREVHALGRDLFLFLLDESNFMQEVSARNNDPEAKGQAEQLYETTTRRIQSRFMQTGGVVPGMVLLCSSKTGQDSFMERRKKDAKKQIAEGAVRVSEFSIWQAKGREKYTAPFFYVEVGDRLYPSRILDAKTREQAQREARTASLIREVPGEYFSSFEKDVEQALRELAGQATYGLAPLIRQRHRIYACITNEWSHPFTRPEISISDESPTLIDEFFVPERVFKIESSFNRPRIDPNRPRFIHIDIAFTGDALGMACGHVHGMKRVMVKRPDGLFYENLMPEVYIDFMLRVTPPRTGEIDLSKVRSFIQFLRDSGLPIGLISFDGYQSKDSAQVLRKAGFETQEYSVDRTDEAYMSLKQGFFDERIKFYEHPHFLKEVEHLERDLDNQKIDHPLRFPDGTRGSKDVADCVAAVFYLCTNMPEAYESTGLAAIGPSASTVFGGSPTIPSGLVNSPAVERARQQARALRRK